MRRAGVASRNQKLDAGEILRLDYEPKNGRY
jgi:hypothetical protein